MSENNRSQGAMVKKISKLVEQMNRTSEQMFDVLEQQMAAIITSESEKVQHLSEEHSLLRQRFEKHQQKFVGELKMILGEHSGAISSGDIRLSALKNVYPDAAGQIEQWKESLSSNASRLLNKHEQVVRLLEFALVQNRNMMHTIYSLHNEKNTHYSQKGDKKGPVTGAAVNQEA